MGERMHIVVMDSFGFGTSERTTNTRQMTLLGVEWKCGLRLA